jgi:hypothetical protein
VTYGTGCYFHEVEAGRQVLFFSLCRKLDDYYKSKGLYDKAIDVLGLFLMLIEPLMLAE